MSWNITDFRLRLALPRRAADVLALGLLAAVAGSAQAPDSLHFFKNYFVTGDYAVGGMGLQNAAAVNGFSTGGISISGVPQNADILAAFLYWATVEHTPGSGAVGAKFGYPDQQPLLNDISKIAKPLGSGTPPCWSQGGATGSGGNALQLAIYRADVLRFIPIDPHTGKRWVNRVHTVMLPNSGHGNATPLTEGASLVVVYRDSATYGDANLPLKSIVIYDGSYTMNQTTQMMSQQIQGFYQASTNSPVARMTHIVANGQAKFGERLLVNGQVIATNPFKGAQGAAWDNPTFDVSALMPPNAASLTTTVDHAGSAAFDCLSWGAVILSTTVQDSDGDGLLDTWETNGFTDIATGAFVDLPAMGANPNVKDIFVQLDYMTGNTPAPHSHLPGKPVLDKVASVFRNAPGGEIKVHFDVGNNYQTSPPDAAIVPYAKANGARLALGGNAISESTTCTSANCLFPNYPGTVGWKTGFRYIRDSIAHFSYSRKDVFHYGLFAHALGLPTAPGSGIPKSVSGISDLLGGDFMVTLGLWDNNVGSEFMQESTLLHELGHNLALRHGGGSQFPNCKPNYQSSMNYLFQVSGLLMRDGTPTIDYSRGELGPLNESSLSKTAFLGYAPGNTLPYQARWFVPAALSPLNQSLGTDVATRHCDGSPINPGSDVSPAMVRIDEQSVVQPSVIASPIDWNVDGLSDAPALDLNFSGSLDAAYTGYNDWTNIDLRQAGGRRNVIKLSLDIVESDLATGDSGLGDSGLGDSGLGDSGLGDSGLGDSGLGDSGLGDSGLGAEMDFETATAVANPPSGLAAVAGEHSVTLNWNPPNAGAVTQYKIYRAAGTVTATNLPVLIQTLSGTPPATTYTDPNLDLDESGADVEPTYSYLVVAVDSHGKQSGPSNIVTVTLP